MTRIYHRFATTLSALTTLLALGASATLVLTGCGGVAPGERETIALATAAATARGSATAATDAEPIDHGARTRQGRYLTATQAREMSSRLAERWVPVDASCCGPEAADLDASIAFGIQAAANLPSETPFMVSGRDPRQAAAVANRLSDRGASQVYLVTR